MTHTYTEWPTVILRGGKNVKEFNYKFQVQVASKRNFSSSSSSSGEWRIHDKKLTNDKIMTQYARKGN